MNPHQLLDKLDDALSRLQRGENAAAQHIILRLHDEAKREAIEMDSWANREERRNYVGQ
jgi:hypothetical protein